MAKPANPQPLYPQENIVSNMNVFRQKKVRLEWHLNAKSLDLIKKKLTLLYNSTSVYTNIPSCMQDESKPSPEDSIETAI